MWAPTPHLPPLTCPHSARTRTHTQISFGFTSGEFLAVRSLTSGRFTQRCCSSAQLESGRRSGGLQGPELAHFSRNPLQVSQKTKQIKPSCEQEVFYFENLPLGLDCVHGHEMLPVQSDVLRHRFKKKKKNPVDFILKGKKQNQTPRSVLTGSCAAFRDFIDTRVNRASGNDTVSQLIQGRRGSGRRQVSPDHKLFTTRGSEAPRTSLGVGGANCTSVSHKKN